MTMLANRLKKNLKKLKSMLKTYKTNAYRLYCKDIPEYPYYIDIYNDIAVVFEKGKKDGVDEPTRVQKQQEIIMALDEVLKIPEEKVFLKTRTVHNRSSQYDPIHNHSSDIIAVEGEAKFIIKPDQYLDCGLFLGHRNLRKKVSQESESKKLLNLFCYTGSFSIQALLGGADQCVNVDMSKTYLSWFDHNAKLNKIDSNKYININENALEWLKTADDYQGKFDIIILDPPSFSNSKSMRGTFDVQRDHSFLVRRTMEYLKKDGVLYFSNNKLKFKIDESFEHFYQVKDITQKTIPMDFLKSGIHKCFEIRWK